MKRWAMNALLLTAFKAAEFLFGLALLFCAAVFVDHGGYAHAAGHKTLLSASLSTAIDIIKMYYVYTGYWLIAAASILLVPVWATRRAYRAAANAGSFFIPAISLLMLDSKSFLTGLGAIWLLIFAFDAILPLFVPFPGKKPAPLGPATSG